MPILDNGSESLPVKNRDENVLGIFERSTLKRIYGPMKGNGTWRSRYNHELYK
jgi:hypothetical protein